MDRGSQLGPIGQAAVPNAEQKEELSVAREPVDTTDLDAVWGRVREAAGNKAASRVLLRALSLRVFEDGRAVLDAEDPAALAFARDRAEQLGTLFKQALGAAVRVSVEEAAGPALHNGRPAGAKGEAERASAGLAAAEKPEVRVVVELFDARVLSAESQHENGIT